MCIRDRVQVAQQIGRREQEEAHGYAQAAVQMSALLGILFAAVVLILLKPLIGFFKLEDAEALAAAFSYTKIACGLIMFSFLSLTLTGLYTCLLYTS